MSDYESLIAGSFDAHVQMFARSDVVYTPAAASRDATPIPLPSAIVFPVRSEEAETITGLVERRVREITLIVDPGSPHYCGVEQVALSATFVISGEVWEVDKILEEDAYGRMSVKLIRSSQTERTRPGYRRRDWRGNE